MTVLLGIIGGSVLVAGLAGLAYLQTIGATPERSPHRGDVMAMAIFAGLIVGCIAAWLLLKMLLGF